MTEAKPNPILQAYGGRMSRRPYWLFLALHLAVYAGLQTLIGAYADWIALPIWILIGGRRLHDFGKSAWWALIPFGAGFAGGFLRSVGVPMPAEPEWMIVLAILSLTVMAVIGLWPGDKATNRFGPPSAGVRQGPTA